MNPSSLCTFKAICTSEKLLDPWKWKSPTTKKLLEPRDELAVKNIIDEFTHLYISSLCWEIIVICHNLGHPNASLPGRNNCFELFIETVQPSAKEFSDHQKKKS